MYIEMLQEEISGLIEKISLDWERIIAQTPGIHKIDKDIITNDIRRLYDLIYAIDFDNSESKTPKKTGSSYLESLVPSGMSYIQRSLAKTQNPEPKPEPKPKPEVVQELKPEPVIEPEVLSEPVTDTEPVTEPLPEPVILQEPESEPKPITEPKTEIVPEPEIEPLIEPEHGLEPEPVTEIVPEHVPEPLHEPVILQEPEPKPESESEPVIIPDPESESEPKSEPEPKPEPLIEPEPEIEPLIESEPGLEPEPEHNPALEVLSQDDETDEIEVILMHKKVVGSDIIKEPVETKRFQQNENNIPVFDSVTENPHPAQQNEFLKSTTDLFNTPKTIADIFQNSSDNSYAARMQKNPINDIKSAIGINEKYLFINTIFDGEISLYNKVIDRLNELPDFYLALHFIDELKANYEKETNRDAFAKLLEIVKRKYL